MLFRAVSVSVEAKELKTCRSLVEANCATQGGGGGGTRVYQLRGGANEAKF